MDLQNVVYVYADDGASAESVKHTVLMIENDFADKLHVRKISAKEILANSWRKNAAIFVLPGGADIPYVKKLQGEGDDSIREFVRDGGSFIGICAGAYYASSHVEFDQKGGQKIAGKRNLGFCEVKAQGPVLAPYSRTSNSGACAATIAINMDDEEYAASLFFNGGCTFEHADKYEDIAVIGHYLLPNGDKLPAIFYKEYGKGNILLSGVHFEYDPLHLDAQDVYLKQIIPLLSRENALRKQFIKRVFNKLLF